MIRPLELAHYFTTNDVFPPSGLPTLNSYLAQLTTSIESVESEILKLRAFLHAKKQEKCGLEQEYATCVGIKSPIRRLPVELLGLIFSFAVGAAPFNRYIHITHLRGVCSSWRHAATTTPGLWTSLTIDLDRWAPPYSQFLSDVTLLDQFKEELSPWIAILSRTRPIHLTLTSQSFDDDIEINDPGFNRQRKLAGHLLSMTPPPATLTLNSPLALLAAILADAPSVVEIEVSYEATRGLEGFTILEARFPCLKALKIHGSLAINTPPFPHSSLQALHLGRGIRPDFFLQELLCTLPCLRELKLGFPDHLDLWNPPDVPETTYVHRCLEILIIEGENQLFTLTGISFPRLRLLDISGCAHAAIPDEIVASHFHPDTFARSPSEPLLVSLSGDFPQALLIRLLASLPPGSHLYLNVGQPLRLLSHVACVAGHNNYV
ncbi:hypothetical protein BKA70DRAFT_1341902 [Coprinopsis sp. MPI-PUGE-AT-0042]|nr:hypothetical protein BKA70DRAFT_1341902 [Coprinopsis sp. MPI-PUGE-AT-0042]